MNWDWDWEKRKMELFGSAFSLRSHQVNTIYRIRPICANTQRERERMNIRHLFDAHTIKWENQKSLANAHTHTYCNRSPKCELNRKKEERTFTNSKEKHTTRFIFSNINRNDSSVITNEHEA